MGISNMPYKKLYYDLDPHQGYYDLLNIAKNKFNDNYFVITSNVDSNFSNRLILNNYTKFMVQKECSSVWTKNVTKKSFSLGDEYK